MEVLPMMMVTATTDVMQFAHMLLEVEVATKALCANLAGERFLIVVCVHVKGKIVHLMKGLVADVTLVRFVAAVCQFVVFVVSLLMESFATEFADEWFVSGVNSCVRVQGGRSIECLSASVAFVRLF